MVKLLEGVNPGSTILAGYTNMIAPSCVMWPFLRLSNHPSSKMVGISVKSSFRRKESVSSRISWQLPLVKTWKLKAHKFPVSTSTVLGEYLDSEMLNRTNPSVLSISSVTGTILSPLNTRSAGRYTVEHSMMEGSNQSFTCHRKRSKTSETFIVTVKLLPELSSGSTIAEGSTNIDAWFWAFTRFKTKAGAIRDHESIDRTSNIYTFLASIDTETDLAVFFISFSPFLLDIEIYAMVVRFVGFHSFIACVNYAIEEHQEYYRRRFHDLITGHLFLKNFQCKIQPKYWKGRFWVILYESW